MGGGGEGGGRWLSEGEGRRGGERWEVEGMAATRLRMLSEEGGAKPRETRETRETRVWATLVNGNSANYTSMALVQILSARLFSCFAHVTLVTPEVSEHVRSLLSAAGSSVVQVERVVWPHEPLGVIDNYRWLMTKLQLWQPNVTGHEKVAFIDADIFLLSPRADELFSLCDDQRADLCAASEPNNPTINGGTLVVRPSHRRYRKLLEALQVRRGRCRGGCRIHVRSSWSENLNAKESDSLMATCNPKHM